MNIQKLRKMIREEIESVLDEEFVLDDHSKFRTLISEKLCRNLRDDECYHETWIAWNDLLLEACGETPDEELIKYYVDYAASIVESDS